MVNGRKVCAPVPVAAARVPEPRSPAISWSAAAGLRLDRMMYALVPAKSGSVTFLALYPT